MFNVTTGVCVARLFLGVQLGYQEIRREHFEFLAFGDVGLG